MFLAEAGRVLDAIGRLLDGRLRQFRHGLELDALVGDVDADEFVARAGYLDRGVAGVDERPGHEAAGVRRRKPVGQRGEAGTGEPAGVAHHRGLQRSGREDEAVLGAEGVGVERNPVVDEFRPDAPAADEGLEYVFDVRLGRLPRADVDGQERTLCVYH